MILYFTSTGNCRYAAERIAAAIGDRTAPIAEMPHIHLAASERLGFVFPTYFWRLPSVVDEYMESVTITSEDPVPYIYFVATFGSTCGQTGTFMKKHLKKKGFALTAAYGIKTADDWTVWFDMNDKEALRAILAAEEPQIDEVIAHVTAGTRGNQMKHKLPMIAVCGSNIFYKRARRTKHLHVEDTCIGCGLCERECPTSAIQLQNDRPVWVKTHCTMCLHCLHACPKFAIQYDEKTKAHGQYMHP